MEVEQPPYFKCDECGRFIGYEDSQVSVPVPYLGPIENWEYEDYLMHFHEKCFDGGHNVLS